MTSNFSVLVSETKLRFVSKIFRTTPHPSRAHPAHPAQPPQQMDGSDYEDDSPPRGGGGGGGGAARSGGKSKGSGATPSSASKKARAAAADDEEGSDAPAADEGDDAGPRLRAARGGRPAPTAADKVAQAARAVANTLAAEVAAKKEADKAAHAMQALKDGSTPEVKWVLTSVRAKVAEAVGGGGLSHADTIKFLNACSKGFAVRRARAPHAPHARALTPHPAPRRCGPTSSTRRSRASRRRPRARRPRRPRWRPTRRLLRRLVAARVQPSAASRRRACGNCARARVKCKRQCLYISPPDNIPSILCGPRIYPVYF